MKRVTLILFGLLIGICVVGAADTQEKLSLPLVAPIPIPSVWTMTYELPKVADAGTAHLVSVQFAYETDLRQQISVWSDGRRREDWLAKGMLLVRQNGTVFLIDPRSEALATSLNERSFAEFSWISAANYERHQKVNGRDCNVFRDGEKTAAIDMETKLPVQLTVNGQTSNYAFADPVAMSLPQDCVEKLAALKREAAKITSNRAPR